MKPTNAELGIARWQILMAAGACIAGLLTAALVLTRPLPPRTIVMATDPHNGAYRAVGERYREFFESNGVRLELRETNGTVDNVALLSDARSQVSVALVQSGITSVAEAPNVVSLGTLFYEPFWLFSRVADPDRPREFRTDLRMSLGVPGSGTYKLARELARAVGWELHRAHVRDLSPVEAGEAIMRGDLDYVAMVLTWDAPIVQRLLHDTSIEARGWPRADAQVALH